MSKVWVTSDLHFNHENIIKYCQRPFDHVDHMNTALIDNWNSVVSPEDEVYVLGDVVMGKRKESLKLLQYLEGRKILVAGNHDACWHGHKKHLPAIAEYKEAGFDEIIQGTYLFKEASPRNILMSHFPFAGNEHDERYYEHHPKDYGDLLLHGHVHEVWHKRGRMFNVGVDVNGFTPVSLDVILEWAESFATS